MRLLIVTCLLFAVVLVRTASAGPHEDADAAYARGDYREWARESLRQDMAEAERAIREEYSRQFG